MSAQERRRFPRISSHLPVQLFPRQSSKIIQTLTNDVSVNGLRCVSPVPLPTTSPCLVELLLGTGQEPVYLEASVIWSKPIPNSEQYHLGFSFDATMDVYTSRLSTYLEKASGQLAGSSA